jgi:hypothetical protein
MLLRTAFLTNSGVEIVVYWSDDETARQADHAAGHCCNDKRTCRAVLNAASISPELKVRNARIVVVPRSRRVRSIHGALVESSRPIVSRNVSVVSVECSRTSHISRIGLRCGGNRTKRNSCGNGNDQDLTHDLIPSVHLSTTSNQTCAREQGFASANYKCLIPYGWANALPPRLDRRRPLKKGLYFRWRFPLASLARNLFLYEGQPCAARANVAVAGSINPLTLGIRLESAPFRQNSRRIRRRRSSSAKRPQALTIHAAANRPMNASRLDRIAWLACRARRRAIWR